ncbi:g2431 [Coccomyxa viridis]|uniref:G2431 protein n=1 Tax=Coccomyxa viridis TaxID=1274662 RepID=A0ABP1FKD0_9CHLO
MRDVGTPQDRSSLLGLAPTRSQGSSKLSRLSGRCPFKPHSVVIVRFLSHSSSTPRKQQVTREMATRLHNGGAQMKRGARNSRATRQWPQNGGEGPQPRVDFNKMKVASLRRYIQHNEIQEVDPQSPKDELVAAVSRHWYSSVVKEEMVLYNLVTAFKKAHADRRT